MRPLEGITVVALEQVIAGPFATRQLAELGARVIKIERPGGGDAARAYDRTVKGLSSHFVWTNRSKESLALDVKHPAAKEVLARLIAKADVFLQNLAPGAAERLGLGPLELRAKHPALIWCGISGYGPAGPYAEKKAYDLLVQCEAGPALGDRHARVAVEGRHPGGRHRRRHVRLLRRSSPRCCGAAAPAKARRSTSRCSRRWANGWDFRRTSPPTAARRRRARAPHHATIVPYGPFRAGDGGTVFLSVQNEREFARFCERRAGKTSALETMRGSPPARRGCSNREAMHAEIEQGVRAAEDRRSHRSGSKRPTSRTRA